MKELLISAFALFFAITASAQELAANTPLVTKAQGSFLAGGTVMKAGVVYDTKDQTNQQGQTLRGDHWEVDVRKAVHDCDGLD